MVTDPKNKSAQNWFKNRLLRGIEYRFLCYFPFKKSLSQWLLSLFYSGIRIDPEQKKLLHQLPKNAVIVYVNKIPSTFEYLFYHNRFPHLGLKPPEISMEYRILFWQPVLRLCRVALSHLYQSLIRRHFPDPYDSGYIGRHLDDGKAAMVALIDERGFNRRFVHNKTGPIQFLIEYQKESSRPVYLVPILMVFGRKPQKTTASFSNILFGTNRRPGFWRKVVRLFTQPEKIFVEVSEPVNLQTVLAQTAPEDHDAVRLSLAVRGQLLEQINRHHQRIIGPILKNHLEIKESILTTPRLENYMSHYAETKKMIPVKVHKKASGYVDEIAARYSPLFVDFAAPIVKWIITTMFDGVSVNTQVVNRLKTTALKGPLIFVPCHKSHMDYLTLPYVLYTNNLPSPHIVAGKNMFFWPFGPIARAGGAFSIRRTFRGAALYTKVFAEYVYKLLNEGFNIKIFIEGTRSRSGKLLMPKLGFLSILVNACKNGACDDMAFVPIYIGYDQVVEDNAYLHELEGGEKKPESIFQVIKARKFLNKRHGRIYVRFSTPITLTELSRNARIDLMSATTKETNRLTRELGDRIINAIDQNSLVTPHALVAAAFLNSPQDIVSYKTIEQYTDIYLKYLDSQKTALSDTLLINSEHAIEQVVTQYIQKGYIDRMDSKKEAIWSESRFQVVTGKRTGLDYYKNNCIFFFIPAAITAATILTQDAFLFASTDLDPNYRFLEDLLQNEFSRDLDSSVEKKLRKCLKAFIDEAMLIPHPTMPDTYNLTSAGFRKLQLFANFLKPFLESYLIVATVLQSTPRKKLDGKKRLKVTLAAGERMVKNKDVRQSEAVNKNYFNNALTYFTAQKVFGAESMDRLAPIKDKIQRHLEYLPD